MNRLNGHARTEQDDSDPANPAAILLDMLEAGLPAWQKQAACRNRGNREFYPAQGGDYRYAIKICETCTVRVECLEYALDNVIVHGIWGGVGERRRKNMRIQRRKTA